MRRILTVREAPPGHWVGDGFPVRSLLSPNDGTKISPFLLVDHAGPHEFAPSRQRRGVGAHPHRGFETVTIVYSGEVAHRDSTGLGCVIGPGDVQWMTAGSGIVHEEFHSQAFTRNGGTLEMVQLWINLPAKDKDARAAYQTLLEKDIPSVDLPEGAGSLRVIAGSYGNAEGPARLFTPIEIWDVRLNAGRPASLEVPDGYTLTVVVLAGTVEVNGAQIVRVSEVAILDKSGGGFTLEAAGDAKLLVLAGEPINEPIVAHGPFVMNTPAEIEKAMLDYRQGRFGKVPAA